MLQVTFSDPRLLIAIHWLQVHVLVGIGYYFSRLFQIRCSNSLAHTVNSDIYLRKTYIFFEIFTCLYACPMKYLVVANKSVNVSLKKNTRL